MGGTFRKVIGKLFIYWPLVLMWAGISWTLDRQTTWPLYASILTPPVGVVLIGLLVWIVVVSNAKGNEILEG